MNFRRIVIDFLENYEWYYRFKYGRVVKNLVEKRNPQLVKSRALELALYEKVFHFLRPTPVVFDVGASVGNTTEVFLELGASVVAIEPNPKNLACLKARFHKNDNVKIFAGAISDKVEKSWLFQQQNGNSLHTLSSKWKETLESKYQDRFSDLVKFSSKVMVETTTLDDLIRNYEVPSYIKIDVEGLEEKVLAGLTKKIRCLSFEANLPEFLEESCRCIEAMRNISHDAEFNFFDAEDWMYASNLKADDMIEELTNLKQRQVDVFCFTNS